MIKKSMLIGITAVALLGTTIAAGWAATPEEAQAMAEKAAALVTAQGAIQRMLPRKRGSVVFMASIAGIDPFPGLGAYSVSKAGLVGLAKALENAITSDTCAFLFEPIQCEAGILIPPDGFLREAAEICRRHGILMIADEVQTGLGRTGRLFACQHEGVQPDMFILGKALSGGVLPVSAVVSSAEILGVIRPGSHGSTYGGNPLACAVARAALQVIVDEKLADRSATLGASWLRDLQELQHPNIREIRGRGRQSCGQDSRPSVKSGARSSRQSLRPSGCKTCWSSKSAFRPPSNPTPPPIPSSPAWDGRWDFPSASPATPP